MGAGQFFKTFDFAFIYHYKNVNCVNAWLFEHNIADMSRHIVFPFFGL